MPQYAVVLMWKGISYLRPLGLRPIGDRSRTLRETCRRSKWKSAWIHFDEVYVDCERCGVRAESLEWIDSRVRYTKRLAEEIARECRLFQSIKTVAERSHLHWETVKEIDKTALGRELTPPDFSALRKLAIDEISIKKRHKYATVAADAERYRVLWVAKDRKEASWLEFYGMLGPEGYGEALSGGEREHALSRILQRLGTGQDRPAYSG